MRIISRIVILILTLSVFMTTVDARASMDLGCSDAVCESANTANPDEDLGDTQTDPGNSCHAHAHSMMPDSSASNLQVISTDWHQAAAPRLLIDLTYGIHQPPSA